MVVTRRRTRSSSGNDVPSQKDTEETRKRKAKNDDDDSDKDANAEDPPKPVSSDGDTSQEDDSSVSSSVSALGNHNQQALTRVQQQQQTQQYFGMSRLFAPYRTLGVVSSGRPFHLIPHQSSQSAMACVPIGDRFQLLGTDKLQPLLVSQAVPNNHENRSSTTSNRRPSQQHSRIQEISHAVSDATLSITLVTHGTANSQIFDTVTLYHRTRPLETRSLLQKYRSKRRNLKWSVQAVLHTGRIKMDMVGEKEGRKENAAVYCIVLAKTGQHGNNASSSLFSPSEDPTVPIVGDDDEDDSDSDDDLNVKSSEPECLGQVVVMLATRNSLQMHRRIHLSTLPNVCPITAVHPATYLNKIVLGGVECSKDGDPKKARPSICLLNVRSTKIVHVFQCLPDLPGADPRPDKVLALEQSPAVDTIAVGTKNGMVHLVNLRHDTLLFSLRHRDLNSQPVAITSISFRTDGSAMRYGIAPMAVGRSDGTITVWDLTPPEDPDAGRTILYEMDRVHVGGVSMLQYLPQEPLLLSIGKTSNSVLMHIFDNPNHSGRILRQRRGHSAPPTRIRYLRMGGGAGGGVLVNDSTDASVCQILSSGGPDRTLRVFSTARSVLDKEYSQGKGLEKRAKKLGMEDKAELLLPPLTNMALADSRSRDWGDLVTIHQDHSFAYVWSTKRGAQSGPILRQPDWNVSSMKVPPPRSTHATSVTMSACGNFALVGTVGGIIYKYNVESGNQRGAYPRDLDGEAKRDQRGKGRMAGDVNRTSKALEKKLKVNTTPSNLDRKDQSAKREQALETRRRQKLAVASHAGYEVTGLAVDSLNKTVISVGKDKKLILWHFSTHAPHKKSPYALPSAATKMCHVRESNLAAIALEDFSVLLFDCTTLSIVRRFGSRGSSNCHSGPITDLGFSPDGRTFFTSSFDGTIRVFDVPTNACVDWLSFKAPPTSMTVSPTGEFLATTHSGRLGISIWSDRSYYQTVQVDGSHIDRPALMDDPVPLAENRSSSGPTTSSAGIQPKTASGPDVDADDDTVPTPKAAGLVTLSGFAPSHWKNLFHLDLVKERNKPKQPPKKPPSAPFFLQWRRGEPIADTPEVKDYDKQNDEGEWAAAWSDDEADNTTTPSNEEESKRAVEKNETNATSKRRKVSYYRSPLASYLQECSENHSLNDKPRFQPVTDYIATLGPSAIDVALSSLCNGTHDLDDGLPLLVLACSWLIEACESRERFEAINAYLHRFLHVHATVIGDIDRVHSSSKEDDEKDDSDQPYRDLRIQLVEKIAKLKVAQHQASIQLDAKMQESLCLLRHFSRMV